jgi:hypothetical protein
MVKSNLPPKKEIMLASILSIIEALIILPVGFAWTHSYGGALGFAVGIPFGVNIVAYLMYWQAAKDIDSTVTAEKVNEQ